ncbi:MAG: Xaa-Pro peptidase family protein [Caldilineaceae bacterium]
MSDALPQIPAGEYPQRWRRVQQMMEAEQLDLLIAYADDRAVFGPAHARWLANFPVHFEPVCVVLACSGEPLLLCGPESDQYALLSSRIRDVYILREFTHPDEDYPFSLIRSLAEVAAMLVSGSNSLRRVGVAGRGLIGYDFYVALQEALPGVEWLDVETAMCSLRARKSEAEQAVMRYAYSIAEAGIAAAVAAIAPGVTEREIAAAAEAAMRHAGAEGTGIDTIVASGPHARPILGRSTFRRIEENDLVLLTVAPRYEGYHAAIGRPVLVGSPDPQAEKALEVAVQAQIACRAALRPGVEGRAVEAVGRRIVEEAGLGQYFLYSGVHSVGVIEFEPPIFGPSSSAAIEQGMVISIDIPIFNAPWGGLRIEDGYLITDTGAEHLHDTPFAIRC